MKEKLLLIDFSQIILSNIFVFKGIDNDQITEKTFISLCRLLSKFGITWKNTYICCDSNNSNYWRKQYFKEYKNTSKHTPEWAAIYSTIEYVKTKFKSRDYGLELLEIDGVEADDIIYVIVQEHQSTRNIIIASGDKDFKQLHSKIYPIIQYDPIHDNEITCEFPKLFLEEQIIKGDRSDCIPNILSPEDCLVKGIRQKSVTKKFLNDFINNRDVYFKKYPELYVRYDMNRTLIDLSKIPLGIISKIVASYSI